MEIERLRKSKHEITTRQILKAVTDGTGYMVQGPIKAQTIIRKSEGEWLTNEEFNYWSRAEFDFVIFTDEENPLPVFAVEYDGPQHLDDPKIMRRDAIKNRLCKRAEFPLLRVGLAEINTHDQSTLLTYMVDRFISWEREKEEIFEEVFEELRQRVTGLHPELASEIAQDYDPTEIFDMRHPFTGTEAVGRRLLEQYKISGISQDPLHRHAVLYSALLLTDSIGPAEDEQFIQCKTTLTLYEGPSFSGRELHKIKGWARIRQWLPTHEEIAPLPADWQSPEFMDAVRRRAEATWQTAVPGVWPWSIAEHFAEYDASRRLEEWAKRNLG
jgi:hypothetical protein